MDEAGIMDVVGFGALNVDRIYFVDEIPDKDGESFVMDLKVFTGGSAANTIVGLSRLGFKSGLIGKTGSDEDGNLIVRNLVKENVDVSSVIKSEGRSGNAIIFVDREGNRAIIVDSGVNDTIRYDDVNVDAISKSRILHLTSFVCKISNDSLETQKKLVDEIDINFSFDPGRIYAKKGLKSIKEIIEKTDIFLPGSAELELLVNKNYREAAVDIIDMGAKIVAVKLGQKGCFVTDGVKEFDVPSIPVKVVDTTGAGDAFNAGFLYAYLKGMDLRKCGEIGNLVASFCIQHAGARSGLPSITAIKRYI